MEKRIHCNNLEVRGEGDEMRIGGYAVVYDQWTDIGSWYKEKIERGALTEALQKSDLRLLLNHDANHLLARQKSGTLTVREDEKGLYFEATLPESRKDVYENIKRGDLDQCSFAFIAGESTWRYAYENEDLEKDERVISSIKEVRELTLATWGAYSTTSVDVRTYEEEKQKHIKENNNIKIKEEERQRVLDLLSI